MIDATDVQGARLNMLVVYTRHFPIGSCSWNHCWLPSTSQRPRKLGPVFFTKSHNNLYVVCAVSGTKAQQD